MVLQFLIAGEPSCFGLIERAFKALLGSQFIYACAVCRHCNGQRPAEQAPILLFEEVAHSHIARKVEVGESNAHLLLGIGGVIEGHNTFGAVEHLNILHKHICAILLFHHIGLQPKNILVHGNKLFVLHQCKGVTLYIVEVATDEQRRAHNTPHSKMGFVLLVGEAAAHLKHIHIVVTAVACVCRQIEALVNDTLHRSPAEIDVLCCAPGIGNIASPDTGESPTT